MKSFFVFLATALLSISLFMTSCQPKPDLQYKVEEDSTGAISNILAWEINHETNYDVGNKVYYCIGGIDASVRIYESHDIRIDTINGKPTKVVYTGIDGWQPVHYGEIVSKTNLKKD